LKRLWQAPLLRQGGAYGLVGLVQLLLDWLVYVLLTSMGINVVASNVIARACGALVGFGLNGAITFRSPEGARLGMARLFRFLVSWGAMTLFSTAAMVLLDAELGLKASWLAKPAVDAALAVLGFLVSRYWIYR